MPILTAAFLIDFAILLGSADPTEQGAPHEDITLSTQNAFRGCAPDPDMCAQLGAACVADGMDPAVCASMADNVCPGARQLSCQALEKVCLDEGGDCDNIIKTCAENLVGCGPAACLEAGTVTPAQAVATCFAYPYALETCEKVEPSAGTCMSLLTWSGCGITTCEWIECMEDVEALGDICPLDLPVSCKAIVACEQAENEAPPADFSLPWRIPPQSCPLIEDLPPELQEGMCEAHPFGRPEGCTADPPSAEKCGDFIDQFAGCGVTTCEYKACADALAKPEAECLGIPPECEGISSCTFGAVFTEPEVFIGCAPPPNMCGNLDAFCADKNIDKARCDDLATVCGADKCTACDAMVSACEAGDGDCDDLRAYCDDGLAGCGCGCDCNGAGYLSPKQEVSLCLAYPWRLDGCGSTPSIPQCIDIMHEPGCDLQSCEWTRCMQDLEELGETCPAEPPSSCDKVNECMEAQPPKTCQAIGALTLDQQFDLCFGHPWNLDGCGEPTEEGYCFYLTSAGECDSLTTCEWEACMAAAESMQNECPLAPPPACAAVLACEALT